MGKGRSRGHRPWHTPSHDAASSTGQPVGRIPVAAQGHVCPLADVAAVNQKEDLFGSASRLSLFGTYGYNATKHANESCQPP